MAVFEYRGLQADTGKPVKGYRDADNQKALRALLRRDGILLTLAAEESGRRVERKGRLDLLAFLGRVTAADIAVMTRQLATLVRAGVPLVDSISALSEQVEKAMLVRVLTAVREKLNAGTSFAKSLEEHPRVFPPLYVNMVAAGEASGTLENVLERLADFMEGQARLRGKVTAALAYPVLMTVIGTVMVSVLMVAVVPKVVSIFDSMGQELPWYTQLLIFASNALAGYWWLFVALGVGGFVAFRRWARFARTLSTLLSSGVPLLGAMEIVKNVLGNALLESVVTTAIGSIREGESIAEPLRRSGEFPPMVTHMIAVGERSGQLEQMLENVSRAYEADVETKVVALTSLLEPLLIVVLGGVVGFIAMSILMPLIQMNELVQ
jgi:general secretion pathway protein F